MTDIELFDRLGKIDDKFYEEALGGDDEKPLEISIAKKPFSVKRLVLPIAACLAVAVGAAAAVGYLKKAMEDGIISFDTIAAADIKACEKLYIEDHPKLGSSPYLRSRVMDLNCDGTDEVFVVTGYGNAPPQIYSKTESGMEKTGELELAAAGTKLTDPNDLFYYDEDGERYWYYSYKCGSDERLIVHAVARINYEDGKYFTDFPLGYGSLDALASPGPPHAYGKNLNMSLTEVPFSGCYAREPFERISADEFIVLWDKHADMPSISGFAYETKYPLIDVNNIPVLESEDDPNELSKAVSAALSVIKEYGDRKLCLIGDGIYRFDGGVRARSLMIAVVENEQMIKWGSVNVPSADGKGYYSLDPNKLDSYVKLYKLSDFEIALFRYSVGDTECECNFFSVSGDSAYPLSGVVSDTSGAMERVVSVSDDVTVSSNSIFDNKTNTEYCFYSEPLFPFFEKRYTGNTVTGKVKRSADYSSSDSKAADQADLDHWKSVIGSRNIARLEVLEHVWIRPENEPDLRPEAVYAIIDILKKADLKLYNSLDEIEIMSGGATVVTAFDEAGNLLFDLSYDGATLSVLYEENGIRYSFKGDNEVLSELNYYMPDERLSQAEYLSSKKVGDYRVSLIVGSGTTWAEILTEHNGRISYTQPVWSKDISEIDSSMIDSYILPFEMKDVTGFAVYESFSGGAPNNGYARFFIFDGNEVIPLTYEYDYAPTGFGSLVHLGPNPEILSDSNTFYTVDEGVLVIDPAAKMIRQTAW